MKRVLSAMFVACACVMFVGCESAKKTDTKAAGMDCCSSKDCCDGMKTGNACSKDCKAACCS